MIEECNFKTDTSKAFNTAYGEMKYAYDARCDLSKDKCLGEANCIIFQIYKAI